MSKNGSLDISGITALSGLETLSIAFDEITGYDALIDAGSDGNVLYFKGKSDYQSIVIFGRREGEPSVLNGNVYIDGNMELDSVLINGGVYARRAFINHAVVRQTERGIPAVIADDDIRIDTGEDRAQFYRSTEIYAIGAPAMKAAAITMTHTPKAVYTGIVGPENTNGDLPLKNDEDTVYTANYVKVVDNRTPDNTELAGSPAVIINNGTINIAADCTLEIPDNVVLKNALNETINVKGELDAALYENEGKENFE